MPDGELRRAVAVRLCGLDIVVIAVAGLSEGPPHAAAEIIWQPSEGGDFVRQTIVWNVAPWALVQPPATGATVEMDAPAPTVTQDRPISLRAYRLTTLGR